VARDHESISKSSEFGINWDAPLTLLNGSRHAEAYPLSSITWFSIAREQKNLRRAQGVLRFIHSVLTEANAGVTTFGYVPLLDSIREAALAQLSYVAINGAAVWQSALDGSHGRDAEKSNQPFDNPGVEIIDLVGAGACPGSPFVRHWLKHFSDSRPDIELAVQMTCVIAHQGHKGIGGSERAEESLWMNCRRCGARLLADFNTAMVTARMTQEQLMRRYTTYTGTQKESAPNGQQQK
jgi:hypothetical protein